MCSILRDAEYTALSKRVVLRAVKNTYIADLIETGDPKPLLLRVGEELGADSPQVPQNPYVQETTEGMFAHYKVCLEKVENLVVKAAMVKLPKKKAAATPQEIFNPIDILAEKKAEKAKAEEVKQQKAALKKRKAEEAVEKLAEKELRAAKRKTLICLEEGCGRSHRSAVGWAICVGCEGRYCPKHADKLSEHVCPVPEKE
jgi:hypothetical protein